MSDNDFIWINAVTKDFGDVRAVDNVDMKIRRGEFFSLLGPSGCGKTTLLRILAGFEAPTIGEIIIDGQPMSAVPPHQRPVNMVFQNYAIFPHLDVRQNIGYGMRKSGLSKEEIHAKVDEMLEMIKLEGYGPRRSTELSGGERQRVALARALIKRPKVLLLDEPLGALDKKLREQMQLELRALQREVGITFVFVTHDQEEALTMSDRIAVMSAGKILQVGSPHDIYEHPAERFVAGFIGETNFLDAEVVATSAGSATVRLPSGKQIAAGLPEGFQPGTKVSLAVRPERAQIIADDSEAPLAGVIDNLVYLGTDTHFHLRLDGGDAFIVRAQNIGGGGSNFATGDRVGIRLGNDAAQILKD